MPPNTGVLIFVPFFHRDESRLPFANRFDPQRWIDEPVQEHWPLIPFSAGPAICAGQQIVLTLTSLFIAALRREHELQLEPPGRLDPHRPLPATLNNYSLRFSVRERDAAVVRRSSPSAA